MTSELRLEHVSGPELVEAWRNGNQLAAEAIFERYQSRLLQVVGNKLNHKLRSRLDPEDVFMSTMRSVFRMTAQEDMEFQDETGLWKWILTVALNKTHNRNKREMARRRNIDLESHDDPSFLLPELDGLTPATEVAVDELLENILSKVSKDQQYILLAKLDGFTHAEIASHLDVSTKKIQRSGAAIREAAVAVLGEEIPAWLKFAEILKELLEEPVCDWLPEAFWRNDLALQSLGQVLHSRNADLQTLDGIRSFAKHKSNEPNSDIPKQVVAAIYLLAISAARLQNNVNISQDSEKILKDRVSLILRELWIDGEPRRMLSEFVESLNDV